MQADTGSASPSGGEECLGPLADELRRIDVEFQRRSEELLQWRLDARARAEHAFPYTVYPVGTNQFHVQHGRNACTAAALAAALYVLNYTAPNVREDDTSVEAQTVEMCKLPWLTIVKTGARLWTEHMQNASAEYHVEVGELLASGGEQCSIVNAAMETVEESAGHTDPAAVAAMDPDSIARRLSHCVQSMPKRTALVVTATSMDVHGDSHGTAAPVDNNNAYAQLVEDDDEDVAATVVVIHLAGDVWWVYDSHGSVNTGNAALLCSCLTTEAVETVLREQLPNGLYSATLFRRKRRTSNCS
jgi:hypothetical protein